jgi:hypothetical protein
MVIPNSIPRSLTPGRLTRELVEALTTLDANTKASDFWLLKDTLSFRTLVEKIDIKDSDKAWLATTYTRDTPEPLPELNTTLARRVSASHLRRQSRVGAAEEKAGGGGFTPRRTSESSVSTDQSEAPTPFVEDETTEEFFYLDQEGVTQGPHEIREILSWYYAGYLHEQVGRLREGSDELAWEWSSWEDYVALSRAGIR